MSTQIIGQESVVSEIEKILNIFKTSECAIRPHFIVTGPSGSGKTLIASTLAQRLQLNFIEINGAQLTKEGTSGNSLSKALSPLNQAQGRPTVVLVDEFDKLFISGNSNDSHAHESTTGVQNEFLKVLESDVCSVFHDYGKYLNVRSDNVLFIFAGAFNGEEDITIDRLRDLGIKTEFLGRVGLVYNVKPLTLEDMYRIIDSNELLDKYCELFEDADKEKIIYLLKEYVQKNHELNTLGARLINTLVHQYFIKGNINPEPAKQVAFQKKLTLNA